MRDFAHQIVYLALFFVRFYHVMHYSAKHGLSITCHLSICLSVHLSVTLVDHDHIG